MKGSESQEDFNLKEFFIQDEPKTFLIGAGCSIDSPSCLPAGRAMMDAILRYSCAETEIENLRQLEELRFEALVEAFRDVFDHNLKLIDYYGQCDKPNIQHIFLANMIKSGHFVITTNFDFLIEYALLQVDVKRDDIIPVITKSDFEKFSDPGELIKEGKRPVYKVHGSTKNIITGEDTRETLIATIQAFGTNKEGLNVFQVEPFKRPLFDNISNARSLIVMGYSGSDDFDIIPTLHALQNIKKIVWINYTPLPKGSVKIQKTLSRYDLVRRKIKTKAEMDRLDNIIWDLVQKHKEAPIPVYRVDVNTSSFIESIMESTDIMGLSAALLKEKFSLEPLNWLEKNIGTPNLAVKYLIPAKIFLEVSKFEDALRCLKEVLHVADEIKEDGMKIEALKNIGMIYLDQGDHSKAMNHFQAAFNVAQQVGDLGAQATLKINIGRILRDLGNLDEALNQCEEAFRISEKLEDLNIKSDALTTIGSIYEVRENYNEALARYKASIKINEQIGDLGEKARNIGKIGYIYFNLKKYQEAISQHEIALEIAVMLGDRSIEADLLLKLAVIYHKIALSQLRSAKMEDTIFGDGMQKVNKAVEIYQDALSIYEELRDIDGQVEVYFSQAALYYNLRMYQEALPRYEAALQILIEHGKGNTEVSDILRDQIIDVKNKIANK